MKKLILYYNFLIISVLVVSGFVFAGSFSQLISAALFYPLFVYFLKEILPKKKSAVVLPSVQTKPQKIRSKTSVQESTIELERIDDPASPDPDPNRRAFIKLIGSAGLAVFIFSVFGVKKAQAAFFGSVPGPGVVALKDSSGNQIDPAEKQPTDGYNITEIDDSVPAYYGFTDKNGAWFIMKEDASGAYRYTAGSSDFTNATTGWPNRENLTYDYFSAIF